MYTTIQELEREIDQFHKNIKESNELMNALTTVASLTKTQTESFELHTKKIQDDLANLTPELNDFFQKKIEGFIQVIQSEHQSYQTSVSKLMDGYTEQVKKAESAFERIPAVLETQLREDREENNESIKQIQEQYAMNLAKTNETFAKQLQTVVESIQTVSEQIKDNSIQQYNMFLKELEKMMDARLAQLSDTENHVIELSQQLEEKHNAFVARLEATNMDQLYKYCQEMNKSINSKLSIVLGGVAVAVIISIISLFI